MGRRGPPPEPTRLKLLKGNPGKRAINRREPTPRPDTPRCPTWLSDEAKNVWRRTVPELKTMGVLSFVDGDALAAYCQTYARWKQAELYLAEHGEVYAIRDEKGNVRCFQQFPQVSIARHLVQQLRSYQQEFGLTPSARSRVDLPLGLLGGGSTRHAGPDDYERNRGQKDGYGGLGPRKS